MPASTARELALAVALDAGDADDLAAADVRVKLSSRVTPCASRTVRPSTWRTVGISVATPRRRVRRRRAAHAGRRRRDVERVGVALDHGAHQGIDLGGRLGRRRDHAAAAQHGHAIGDLLDLGQLVGDQHDAAAAFGDAAADLEQRRDLVRQQHRGRLVEHEQPRLAHQAFDDLDALPLADREVFDLAIGSRARPYCSAMSSSRRAQARAVAARPGLAEQHVVDHGHVAHQAEMLVHHRDAGSRAHRPGRRLSTALRRTAWCRRRARARRRPGCTASTCRRRSRRAGSGSRRCDAERDVVEACSCRSASSCPQAKQRTLARSRGASLGGCGQSGDRRDARLRDQATMIVKPISL